MEGGHPLQRYGRNTFRVAKSDVDHSLVRLLNTHHDNQENILEMIPMSKSVLDEKGKVAF